MTTQAIHFRVATATLPDGVRVVTAEGDIDLATAPELQRELAAVIADGADRVLVDLSAVGFLDSTGIGVLIAAQRSMPPGGRLVVLAGQPRIMRVLELTGVDEYLSASRSLVGALSLVSR